MWISEPHHFTRSHRQQIGLDPSLLRLVTHHSLPGVVAKQRFLTGCGKKFFRIFTAMLLQLAQPEDSDSFVVTGFVVMRTESLQSGTHPGKRGVIAVKLQVGPRDLEMLAMAELLQRILATFKAANFVKEESFIHGARPFCRSEDSD